MNHDLSRGVLILVVLASALLLSAAAAAQEQAFTIEPATLSSETGGTVSIYANANAGVTFTTTTTVRMVGYGILSTRLVNPQALQATVPSGIAAGNYTLLALNTSGGDRELGKLQLIAPPAPTATPSPIEPPTPGQPLLTIRNYRIEPLQVRPGQEFMVHIEVYNNGSRAAENTMVIFPGGTFLPVGENGHVFWQVPINATFNASQKMRVPASVGNGVQNLQVNLSANDFSGAHYEFPQTLAVEVIGASSGSSAPVGKPEIVIQDIVTDPPVIAPGTPFTLTMVLVNLGSRTATNLQAAGDTSMVIPARGGGIATLETLRINHTATLTIPLLLKSLKEGGRIGLPIALTYSDYSGGNYSEQQTVGIDVDMSLANRPQLLIDSYRTEPPQISPGDSFTLTLDVVNVGGASAQRLTLALGGEEGENLGSFVPIEGSNVTFIPFVEAGSRASVAMRLMVTGNAETRAHNLPVALGYDISGGTREKGTQRVSLLVRRRPDFKISFYRPIEGTALAGQPFQLPVELVNASGFRFTISELRVSGEGLESLGENRTYVGPLDPGGSWTLDAMVLAMEPGPVGIVVDVDYVDDLNQTQTSTTTLEVEVLENPFAGENGMPPVPDSPDGQPLTFWQQIMRVFRALLGLGS